MPLRPTPDAMRERAFAVLGDRVVGAVVLDLFAGTGAVGLEALSRGASRVVFVERHRSAARLIEANFAALGTGPPEVELMVRPAVAAVGVLSRRAASFDLVWADPPFESWREGLEALIAARSSGVLSAHGVACLECPARADLGAGAGGLRVVRDLVGGASRVVILERQSRVEDESPPAERSP